MTYETLVDNIKTGIKKWQSCYKMRQKTVIKNLLQSATEVYYKVLQILQSVTVITKWDVTHDWNRVKVLNKSFPLKNLVFHK